MTFLELTNRLLVRLNEAKLTESSFANARNVQELAKTAINNSIFHIHDKCEELPFMYQRDYILSLAIGQTFYDYPDGADKVDFDNVYVQANSSYDTAYKRITPISHDWWKRHLEADHYNLSSSQYGLPDYVFRTPDDKIGFSGPPKYAYNMYINYWAYPTELSSFSDEPAIPARYARIIVDGAEYYLHKMRKDKDSMDAALETFKEGIMVFRSLRTNRYVAMTDTRVPYTNGSSQGYIDDRR